MVKRTTPIQKILFGILILGILLFSLFPFLQMLSLSLKYQWDWGNPSLIPKKINLEAYKELLGIGQELKNVPESVRQLLDSPDISVAQRDAIVKRYQGTGDVFPFFTYFRNSLIFSLGAAFISLCLAVLGAYSFSRVRYRGRGIVQRSVLISYMFGGILLLIPLYRMGVSSGLLSTRGGTAVGLLIVYVIQTLPVSLYMLGNYFRSIPFSIEESAMIEGANRLGIIFRIIVPLSWSALVTVFIYGFMIAWNEYLFASVFLRNYQNLYTLPMGLRSLFVSKNAIWDRIMAASLLVAVPVMAMFMAIQKRLVGGMTEGGVKE